MMEISEEAWLPATLGAGRALRSSPQPGRGAGALREPGLLLAAPGTGTSVALRLWWAQEEAPHLGSEAPPPGLAGPGQGQEQELSASIAGNLSEGS